MNYQTFLKTKKQNYKLSGFDIDVQELNPLMFDFQKSIVKWALKKGKCALFVDTGLGKTLMQLEFADQICKKENGRALILAPLAVSKQTKQEGTKFGYEVNICRSQADLKKGINITNYEMVEHFNPVDFNCIILDESSILKSFMGKTTNDLIERFKNIPYKLCCTATPSPNDYTELGNHAEFLNIMSRTEMLATYFINDAKETQWRLKRHAQEEFWKWIVQWAMVMKNPENLGYDGEKYKLPALNINNVFVSGIQNDYGLFNNYKIAKTLNERREVRKESIDLKIEKLNELISNMDNCLIWVDYNEESEKISKSLNINEVTGSQKSEVKEQKMIDFANGDIKFIVSKPSIMGFGMNFQICNNVIFFGLSDSYEKFYQAIRRCWRFGQEKSVNVYIILSESEIEVLNNIKRKQEQHEQMTQEMINLTSDLLEHEIKNTIRITDKYKVDKQVVLPDWLKEELI